jgi:hypothetical protein
MRLRVDQRFRDEACRFAFRFACEDCAHFDAASDACSLGYPPEPKRAALLAPTVGLCKEFELAGPAAVDA